MDVHTIIETELNGAGNGIGGASSGGEEGRGFWGEPDLPPRAYITVTVLALAGILMFFMAFISADVVRKGAPSGDWRRLGVPHILWLNTAILLASSFTLAHARIRFLKNQEDEFRHWWRITLILGLFFVVGQLIAWWQLAASGVYLATNPASSFFYMLTVAHAIHVFAGILALLAVALRLPRRAVVQTAIDVTTIYWHFTDALWIFLFFFLLSA